MEKEFITTVTLLLALCPAESEGLAVTGLLGGQVEIKCSHKFAKSNIKYFCEDTCTGSDILVQTEDSKNYIERGRYSIDDIGDGDFTVTIKSLKMSDSGTYWCGVDRFFIDTSHEVLLTVLNAPPIQPDITRTSPRPPVIVSRTTVVITTAPPIQPDIPRSSLRPPFIVSRTSVVITTEKAVSEEPLTIATPTEAMKTDSSTGVLVYMGTGLGMVVCVFALILIIFIRQRTRTKITTESVNSKRTAFHPIYPTPANQNLDTSCDITTTTNPCPDDIYSNVGPSTEAPETVSYATVNFPRDPSCLHYTTVNFPRDPSCLHYATVSFSKDTDVSNPPDSVIYSSVSNPPDSVIYSSVSNPPDSVIYSSVSNPPDTDSVSEFRAIQ